MRNKQQRRGAGSRGKNIMEGTARVSFVIIALVMLAITAIAVTAIASLIALICAIARFVGAGPPTVRTPDHARSNSVVDHGAFYSHGLFDCELCRAAGGVGWLVKVRHSGSLTIVHETGIRTTRFEAHEEAREWCDEVIRDCLWQDAPVSPSSSATS